MRLTYELQASSNNQRHRVVEYAVVRTIITERMKEGIPNTRRSAIARFVTVLLRPDKIFDLDAQAGYDKLSRKYYTLEINYGLLQS